MGRPTNTKLPHYRAQTEQLRFVKLIWLTYVAASTAYYYYYYYHTHNRYCEPVLLNQENAHYKDTRTVIDIN